MEQLIIATTNRHKFRELKALLQSLKKWEVFSLLDFPSYTPPHVDDISFEDNAKKLAQHAASALKKWTIADDSRLVVPALSGLPGPLSEIYAGNDATDLDNRKKLLREMKDLKEIARTAYFECALALASPEKLIKSVQASCLGEITTEEKGRGGFSYDAVFRKIEYLKTFAEVEEHVKNQISHRAKAFERLLPYLN